MRKNTDRTSFRIMIGCAALVAVIAAGPALAQFEPANHFPSEPVDDGKFLALAGTEFATLSSGSLSFGLVVPPSMPESTHPCESPLSGDCVYLAIFDGDTAGESVDAAALADYADLESLFPALRDPCTDPGPPEPCVGELHHWDNLTFVPGAVRTVTGNQGTQIGFALFADANQVASIKKRDFLGAWMGDRTDNESRGPDASNPRWIAFSGDFEDPGFLGRGADLTSFPDNALWNVEIQLNGCSAGDPGCPLAATGVNSYHLCIFYNPDSTVFPKSDLDTLLAGYGPDDDVVELCSDIFEADGSGVVRPDPYPRTVSLFKLKGETDIQLLSQSFSFEGGQHNLADTTNLFPDWTPLLTRPQSGTYDPDFFLTAETKYDGEWVFNVFLPSSNPRRELVLFDGDFDFGTAPDPPAVPGDLPGTLGSPSGLGFEACQDTVDADSLPSPDFVAALGAQIACTLANDPTYGNLCLCSKLPAGVTSCSLDGSIDEDAQASGVPGDDSLFDQFRKIASPDPAIWPAADRKCVVYEVRSPGADGALDTPDDVIYRNPNPSSQREWEQFRIVSRCEVIDSDPNVRECACSDSIAGLAACPVGYPEALQEVFDPSKTDAEQADAVVDDAQLADGTWRVTVYGVDLSNLNAWATELNFCPADSPFCSDQPVPYKLGDTVWNDTDLDEKQSLNESGIPGVKVNLVEAGQTLAMKTTGDEDLDELITCENCNTGGDPADPDAKNPVDEEGLYCLDVEVPPAPKRCSVTTSQTCMGDGNCPTGETCVPPPPVNRCSADTSQECSVDADCPLNETCVQNCRDFVIEVDDSNFDLGGPLDGFGPTTTSPQKDCRICEADGGAVTLNCDFGYAPCDECDGKVTKLTLEYLGATAAVIRVDQRKGDTVFPSTLVQPGGEFSFEGVDKQGTLGAEISIYVNGAFHVQIHTSCSQPIFAGLVKGDFRVARGASRNAGALCPGENVDDCGCEGKVTFLRLQYNGSAATVSVEQKNGNVLFGPAGLSPGEQFDLGPGNSRNTYGTDISVFVGGALHTTIHTSCSQAIGPGLVRGDFEVISGRSKEGGNLCPL